MIFLLPLRQHRPQVDERNGRQQRDAWPRTTDAICFDQENLLKRILEREWQELSFHIEELIGKKNYIININF